MIFTWSITRIIGKKICILFGLISLFKLNALHDIKFKNYSLKNMNFIKLYSSTSNIRVAAIFSLYIWKEEEEQHKRAFICNPAIKLIVLLDAIFS